MNTIFLIIFSVFICATSSMAQSINGERILKLDGNKKSVYVDRGVLYLQSQTYSATILNIRSFFSQDQGFERIVFDFADKKLPTVYGFINSKKNKVYLDFFNTTMANENKEIKASKFIKGMEVFKLDKEKVTVELTFNAENSYEIFYLENPARLVIDIK